MRPHVRPGDAVAILEVRDQQVVRIGLSGVTLAFGGATPVLTVTNGGGALLLTAAGVAGSLQGTIAVAIPQVSLTGALAVEFNTIASPVDEILQVAGSPVPLKLPGGPYVRVAGTGIDLQIAGQILRGDIELRRSTNAAGQVTTQVKLENVVVRLGGTAASPIVTITQNGPGTFIVSPAGIAGALGVAVQVTVPGVSLTGTFALQINTTTTAQTVSTVALPAGPFLRVSGTGRLAVLGQELSGSFAVEQATTATGAA